MKYIPFLPCPLLRARIIALQRGIYRHCIAFGLLLPPVLLVPLHCILFFFSPHRKMKAKGERKSERRTVAIAMLADYITFSGQMCSRALYPGVSVSAQLPRNSQATALPEPFLIHFLLLMLMQSILSLSPHLKSFFFFFCFSHFFFRRLRQRQRLSFSSMSWYSLWCLVTDTDKARFKCYLDIVSLHSIQTGTYGFVFI